MAPSTTENRLMVLSIRPEHVTNILAGTKTVELRRTRPRIEPGQPVAIYATAPMSAVVATCEVDKVVSGRPTTVKRAALRDAAISAREFDSYFRGTSCATALHLARVTRLSPVVTLAELRSRRMYHPPQTWHYFTDVTLRELVGDHESYVVLTALLR